MDSCSGKQGWDGGKEDILGREWDTERHSRGSVSPGQRPTGSLMRSDRRGVAGRDGTEGSGRGEHIADSLGQQGKEREPSSEGGEEPVKS